MIQQTKSVETARENAIDFLKKQHREVEKLFADIENEGAAPESEALVSELCDKLIVHSEIEEQTLYPALKKINLESYSHAEREHGKISDTIQELLSCSYSDDGFMLMITNLKETVAHHVEEEENNIFPMMCDELGEAALETMGQKMDEMARHRIEAQVVM